MIVTLLWNNSLLILQTSHERKIMGKICHGLECIFQEMYYPTLSHGRYQTLDSSRHVISVIYSVDGTLFA